MMALKAALAACAAVLAYQYVRAPYLVPDFVGYNVGFPKTGTLAVSDMFAKAGFQSAHEFDRDRLLLPVLQKLANDDTAPLRAYLLRERPARMRAQFGRPALHMDSSSFNLFFVEELVATTPHARFLMTVRRPFAQYDSLLNHVNSRWFAPQMEAGQSVRTFLELVFGDPTADATHYPAEEQAFYRAFKARGGRYAWPFRGVVQSSTYFLRHALSAVPAGKLLLVRTEHLSSRAERGAIEAFLGLGGVLPASRRRYRTEKRGFADALAPPYVAALARAHCQALRPLFAKHGRGDLCEVAPAMTQGGRVAALDNADSVDDDERPPEIEIGVDDDEFGVVVE